MLSRTAENLFWSARYIERADSLARLLEVGYRISLIPNTERGYTNEWESILETSGIKNEYLKKYKTISKDKIIFFLLCFFFCRVESAYGRLHQSKRMRKPNSAQTSGVGKNIEKNSKNHLKVFLLSTFIFAYNGKPPSFQRKMPKNRKILIFQKVSRVM